MCKRSYLQQGRTHVLAAAPRTRGVGARAVVAAWGADTTCRMQLEERSSSDAAVLNLAAFYMHSGRTERARSLAERVLRSASDSTTAQTLLGWIMVGQQIADEDDDLNDTEELYDALSHFDLAIAQDPMDLEVRILREAMHHTGQRGGCRVLAPNPVKSVLGSEICTWEQLGRSTWDPAPPTTSDVGNSCWNRVTPPFAPRGPLFTKSEA
jgi:hypothetical protein